MYLQSYVYIYTWLKYKHVLLLDMCTEMPMPCMGSWQYMYCTMAYYQNVYILMVNVVNYKWIL